MLNVFRDQFLIFLYALLECLHHNLVVFGDTIQDLLLLGLEPFKAEHDVCGHIMTLAFQLNSFDYLVKIVDGSLGTLD